MLSDECERWGWTPTPCESDPSGVSGGLSVPVRHHQETAGDGEGDDAQYDEEQRGDPLRGQLRGDAGPVPTVDGLTLPDQTHSQGAWKETRDGRVSTQQQNIFTHNKLGIFDFL